MARNAVAEIDAPGKRSGFAVSVVSEAGEKAADTAHGDADTQWKHEEIAGPVANSEDALDELDCKPAPE